MLISLMLRQFDWAIYEGVIAPFKLKDAGECATLHTF